MERRCAVSSLFRHIARHLRPGLYLLDNPVRLPSECNRWEPEDARQGDCEPEEVGEPLVYHLHAVRIRGEDEWHGHDEPPPRHLNDRQRARLVPKDAPAVVFSPDELQPLELVRFLQQSRRVRGLSRRRPAPDCIH